MYTVCQVFSLSVSLVLSMASLSLLVTSMAREEWVYYDVPGSLQPNLSAASAADTGVAAPLENWCYFPRFRGLFYECLKSTDAPILQNNRDVRFSRCFELDFGQRNVANRGSNYWFVVNLRRAQIGMLGSALVLSLCGLVTLGVAFAEFCTAPKLRYVFGRARVVAAIFFVLSFLFIVGAIVIFHITMTAEMSRMEPGLTCIWANFIEELQQKTTFHYGGMYGLVWCSALLLLAAALFSLLSRTCTSDNRRAPYGQQFDAVYAAYRYDAGQ